MLENYQQFEEKLVAALKFRSRNYVNTDCDISAAIDAIYRDIISEIHLDWISQPHFVSSSVEFTIPVDNGKPMSSPPVPATERYLEVYDVFDTDKVSIAAMLEQIGPQYTFRWRSTSYLSQYEGKTIYFLRPVQYDIRYLPPRLYDEIFQCVLEGLMQWIEAAIPSQIDGALENRSYQRYYNEKQNLRNRFPQIYYRDEGRGERNRTWLLR